jgi:allantoin racemase
LSQRILFIDPVGMRFTDPSWLEKYKRPDTELTLMALPRGPRHLEFHYYEAMVLMDTLNIVKAAERDGYDATVIGCFYDVGLQAAREVSQRMPVTAPCEASVYLAATMGDKFSIIVGRRKWIPQMMENVVRYGMKDRLASFKPVDLGVLEFHADPPETARRFKAIGREAVERDGAEVIILGCTATAGFHQELQEELGVPVIDPTLASFKAAEMAAELRRQFGWTHSKVGGYETPSDAEAAEWGLDKQYDYGDMTAWLKQHQGGR